MSAGPTYQEYCVDVFSLPNQRVQVLPEVTPLQLIAAILAEFRELEYVGVEPEAYHLRVRGGAVLDEQNPLAAQLDAGERLALVENEPPLPGGTRRPPGLIYLREVMTGRTYRLGWLPAIIGRASDLLPQNDRVAVDLSAVPGGLRVSRRHAVITEEAGQYYVQAWSNNPLSLLRGDDVLALTPDAGKHSLTSGTLLRLDRSDIRLKFILRET